MNEVTIIDLLKFYEAEIPEIDDDDFWTKMQCPFHDDSHASAAVLVSSNSFKCHGCDVSGDVLNVVARFEGFGTLEEPDRKEANEWIARVFGASAKPISRSTSRDSKPGRKPNAWRDALFG